MIIWPIKVAAANDNMTSSYFCQKKDIFVTVFTSYFLSLLILIFVYIVFFEQFHPRLAQSAKRGAALTLISGSDFVPVSVGQYQIEGDVFVIGSFDSDQAIIAASKSFNAVDFPFIKLNLSGWTRFTKIKLMWRHDDSNEIHAYELTRDGDVAAQASLLSGSKDYKGLIRDIAILIYDGPALGVTGNNDTEIRVGTLELRPFSPAYVAEQVWDDWINPPLWSLHSNNYVRSSHINRLLPPNGSILALSLLAVVIVWMRPRRDSTTQRGSIYIYACIVGFSLLLCLRMPWFVEQYKDVQERFFSSILQDKVRNSKLRCSRFPDTCYPPEQMSF